MKPKEEAAESVSSRRPTRSLQGAQETPQTSLFFNNNLDHWSLKLVRIKLVKQQESKQKSRVCRSDVFVSLDKMKGKSCSAVRLILQTFYGFSCSYVKTFGPEKRGQSQVRPGGV